MQIHLKRPFLFIQQTCQDNHNVFLPHLNYVQKITTLVVTHTHALSHKRRKTQQRSDDKLGAPVSALAWLLTARPPGMVSWSTVLFSPPCSQRFVRWRRLIFSSFFSLLVFSPAKRLECGPLQRELVVSCFQSSTNWLRAANLLQSLCSLFV